MKKFLVLMTVAFIAAPLLANPILSHKYTADPQPIVWNDRLYVYASNDDDSPGNDYFIQSYTLVSTDDMANWTDHGEVFKVPRDWNRGNATTARAYAPGAAVRGGTGTVYLYPCGSGGPVGVVTAPRPEGPFTDVLRPANGGTTPALVDRNTCTNCNVPWLFDPAVFVDDDGSAYLYYGGGDASGNPGPGENFRVIRLNNDMISLRRENNVVNAVTINAPRSFEAAYMHKRGSTYYFSYVNNFSGGDSHPNAAIMYMTGTSPMGPFTLRGPVLRNPAIGQNINRNNNNHHAIIEYQNRWYMFYHDRRVANANNLPSDNANRRNISVDSLVYNADGTMREVVVTNDGVRQIKNFNPYAVIGATTINRQSSQPAADFQPGIKADSIAGEGMILTRIANNNWIRLKGVDFGAGASRVTVRAASNNSSGGTIEFRTGSETGTLIGTATITSTGGWNTWRNFEADITNATGVRDFLYLVFKGTGSELLRLSSYQFHAGPVEPVEPDANGYFFHHTFETSGNVNGWAPRWGDVTVANVSTHSANGERSLAVSGRTVEYNGPALSLSTSAFVPGSSYSFSVLAMYAGADGPETATFKFTLQYNLPGQDDAEYDEIATATAVRNQWVMLENANFPIPTNATELVLYVETLDGAIMDFYIDDAMGGIAGATAPGRGGVTSTSYTKNTRHNVSPPSITVRAKTLTVNESPDTKVHIRVINLSGKTVAKFNTQGGSTLSLHKIPAGAYIIEANSVKSGARVVAKTVLK